jgi:DNA replication protein DnaC
MLAGIPEDYWTLDERDYWGDKSALGQVHEYLDNWSGRSRYGLGLEIYSEKTGTGKTMLASLIAKALVKRGVRVTFTLFLPLMGLYKQPYEVRHDFEERLRYNRVLVLDEIGEGISDAQHEYFAVEFENLIRERVSANRVTITTTNRIPAVLDAIYPRVYSILASKQQRIEVQYHDTRMAGRVLQEKDTLAKHNSALPIK